MANEGALFYTGGSQSVYFYNLAIFTSDNFRLKLSEEYFVNWSGNTVKYYGEANEGYESGTNQQNVKGRKYNYIAIA